MPGAVHSSASVGVDSAEDRSWFAAIKRAWRRERPLKLLAKRLLRSADAKS
jgi:hypothetical protein